MTERSLGMGYRSLYNIPLPEDIPGFLTREGVPLDTPLMAGDRGTGRIPGIGGIVMSGVNLEDFPESYQQRYWKQERLRYLYRLLKWYGYFDTPVAERRPLDEVLGINPRRNFDWHNFLQSNSRSRVVQPKHLPMGYGGDLILKKGELGPNAITQEDFMDGEKINVLYTENQLKDLNSGKRVPVKPSMIFKIESVDELLKHGSLMNPLTREKTALRERRTLRLRNTVNKNETNSNSNTTSGGKRRRRKNKKTRRTH